MLEKRADFGGIFILSHLQVQWASQIHRCHNVPVHAVIFSMPVLDQTRSACSAWAAKEAREFKVSDGGS